MEFENNKTIMMNNVTMLIDEHNGKYISYCTKYDKKTDKYIKKQIKKHKEKELAVKCCIIYLKKNGYK